MPDIQEVKFFNSRISNVMDYSLTRNSRYSLWPVKYSKGLAYIITLYTLYNFVVSIISKKERFKKRIKSVSIGYSD